MSYEAAFTQAVHREAQELLLRHYRTGRKQEELCFALWRPSTGEQRTTALLFRVIPPLDGERRLHGGASFEPAYLIRAVRIARAEGAGLAFMHNHFTPGWQAMSEEDVVAERDRIAPPAKACGHPLVGLTLGTDGSWSARFWCWNGRTFIRHWCDKVRVVGEGLRLTYNDQVCPPPARREELRRTIDTWGEASQGNIARLRVGVVGLGSVGCMVAEGLARIGIQHLVLVDGDRVERHNLDRLLYAGTEDVGTYKVDLAARHLRRSATAAGFRVDVFRERIQTTRCYRAALDCDVLFAAVDRPLPKELLNRIAYAHCIPVVFGGVFVDRKANRRLGQAAWSVIVAQPGARCLRCDGQYTSSDVVMERDGSLDDPTYVRRGSSDRERRNENVFPFSANVASLMVLEMVRLVVRERWWPAAPTKLHYSYIPHDLASVREDCDPHCSIRAAGVVGDATRYPFLVETDVPPSPESERASPK